MTINKAQGCSLGKAGIYLNDPVFDHGQLSVALSRVSSLSDIWIVTNSEVESITCKFVYKEIFK
jgi:hypothetical protein